MLFDLNVVFPAGVFSALTKVLSLSLISYFSFQVSSFRLWTQKCPKFYKNSLSLTFLDLWNVRTIAMLFRNIWMRVFPFRRGQKPLFYSPPPGQRGLVASRNGGPKSELQNFPNPGRWEEVQHLWFKLKSSSTPFLNFAALAGVFSPAYLCDTFRH